MRVRSAGRGGNQLTGIQAFVQVVLVRWTKKSRGAPAAAFRNSLPEAAVFPTTAEHRPDSRLLWHDVVFAEEQDFRPREAFRSYAAHHKNYNALEIVVGETGAEFILKGRQRLAVPPRTYARAVFNFAEIKPWDHDLLKIYHKVSVNLIVDIKPTPEMFVERAPDIQLRALVNLR